MYVLFSGGGGLGMSDLFQRSFGQFVSGEFGWRCPRLAEGRGWSLGCAEGVSEGGCRTAGYWGGLSPV